MKLRVLLFLTLLVNTLSNQTCAWDLKAGTTIIYVDVSIRSSGNGLSPSTPYKYLQDGLSLAATKTGDVEIRVAAGTYYPDIDVGGNYTDGDRNASFKMLNNVKIFGGYASRFPILNSRNWNTNLTILSGDINQNGTSKTYQIIKNEYTKSTPLTNTAILNGFVIENSDGSPSNGGGIYNIFSSPKIQYCLLRNNKARIGGAVENIGGIPVFENCIFYDNYASFGGNVMNNESSFVTIINSTIVDNTYGGQTNTESIKSGNSDIIIKNSILWNNGTELVNNSGFPANSYSVTYSDIEGGFSGTGNIDADPLFTDALNNIYTLKLCTPVYNAGTNAVSIGNLDYAGGARTLYDTLDMGAYEYITGRLYVNGNATGNDDGSSWANAYVFLQDALRTLELCGCSGEIWVAQGNYYPDEGVTRLNNYRAEAFKMLNNVKIYGGFLGNETNLGQRELALNTTVLHGDLEQDDHLGDYSGNAYHVVLNNYTEANPLNSSAVLDGFVIFRGWSRWNNINVYGGGIYNKYASPTIRNCKINQNYANSGGGMFNDHSSPIISNCEFNENEALQKGGAMFYTFSNVSITNTIFFRNKATNINQNASGREGGAIAFTASFGDIDGCSFVDNKADKSAGALLFTSSSGINLESCNFSANESEKGGAILIATGESPNPLLGNTNFDNCIFTNNYSSFDYAYVDPGHYGGAIYVQFGTVMIDDCDFDNNITENYGGAIYFFRGSSSVNNCIFNNNWAIYLDGDPSIVTPGGGAIGIGTSAIVSIENSLFKDNQGRDIGGAIYNLSDNVEISNCVFVDNIANEGPGGAIANHDASPYIKSCTFSNINANPPSTISNSGDSEAFIYNSILWGNTYTAEILDFNSSETTVLKSIVKGGYIYSNDVIDEDPLFNAPASSDFTLKRCSPGIDKGDNTYNSKFIDNAGNPRIYNAKFLSESTIDIGAFELQDSFLVDCLCEPNLIIVSGFEHGTYQAAESIIASGTVPSGGGVLLSAENSKELVPPFEADSQTTFRTELEAGCKPN
jgi:hypothetical protein